MREVLTFPDTVNDKAARVVAGGVLLIALAALIASAHWLLVVLFAGFAARVAAGPSLSPLALLATRVVAPRLGPPKPVPGPPKRFAQAMGALITGAGAVLGLGFGLGGAADALLVALIVAAGLEAIVGLCLGCTIFALLMRAGLVPEHVCAQCADVRAHPARPGP